MFRLNTPDPAKPRKPGKKASKIFSLQDFPNLRGKSLLVRVDLNSPIERGKVQSNPRFEAHAETVKLLAGKGAKVVVLAHQGRKGGRDCISLGQHAKILSKLCGRKVLFKEDKAVVSEKTLAAVGKLKGGEVMLLDNVRFLDDEAVEKAVAEHSKSELVAALAPLCQLFVQDAWSNAHRRHASMVGFANLLPCAMGPVFQGEMEGASKAREHAAHPVTYILGGTKPEEVIKLMEYSLVNNVVDKILATGIFGELCLIARGSKLPAAKMEEIRKQGFTQHLLTIRDLIHNYHEFIETPFDFAYADEKGERKEVMLTQLPHCPHPIYDIGAKTARKFSKIAANSKTVFIKGTCGKYEEKPFEHGTRTVFEAVANSKAYSLIGGGHTLTAFEKFGIPKNKISFISLAGGALLEFLQGNELPAVTALQTAAKKFGNKL